ncbi:unnamed protein product, partial [Choristocarpus tenellus]
LLTQEVIRSTSRLSNAVFLPALVGSSIGASLTPEILSDSWHLLVANSFTHILSWTLAWICGRVLLTFENRYTFRPVQVAVAFPNSGALPLLFLESLCDQDLIKSDFGNDEECLDRGTGFVFVYMIGWQLWFFGWGFHLLSGCAALESSHPVAGTAQLEPETSCNPL